MSNVFLRRFSALPLILLLVFGCTKSDYKRPEINFEKEEIVKKPAKNIWLEVIDDKRLEKLIRRALAQNFDIKQQKARLERYVARLGIARKKLYPDLELQGSSEYNKASFKGLQGLNPFMQRYYKQHDVSANLNWEIDLFGRLARNREAANALLAAENLRLADVQNKIASQIVKEYVTAANLVDQFKVLRDKYYNQQKSIDLSLSLFESGVINKIEVNEEKITLTRMKTAITDIKFQINEVFYRIDSLLAQNMGKTRRILNFNFTKNSHINVTQFEKAVDKLLNSEIIENNPTILAKEEELKAANAQLGITRREYFPKFTFNARAGIQAINSNDILSSQAVTSGAGLSLGWRILEFWKINDEIKEAEALRKEQLIAYKQVVLDVLFEIENSANKIIKNEDNIEFWRKILKLRQRNINLARSDFGSGVNDYRGVIKAKAQYYDSKIQLLEAKKGNLEAVVEFFDALN